MSRLFAPSVVLYKFFSSIFASILLYFSQNRLYSITKMFLVLKLLNTKMKNTHWMLGGHFVCKWKVIIFPMLLCYKLWTCLCLLRTICKSILQHCIAISPRQYCNFFLHRLELFVVDDNLLSTTFICQLLILGYSYAPQTRKMPLQTNFDCRNQLLKI